jgi:molybdopterin/thiamine biosynthesis adenylyltransferase
MAKLSFVNRPWRLILPQKLYSCLHHHLFPGDGDEHGAVIAAGFTETARGVRLLARDLHLAVDGTDYVPGKRGYRMLKAGFIADRIAVCRNERLIYLALHNHAGRDHVQFSSDDRRSHERGYPALLDITNGMPVGALVFAENAIAGDIWLPGKDRVELAGASIVGGSFRLLTSTPSASPIGRNLLYDRQARLFGDAGQDILRRAKIGIIGLGGAGSLLAEYLGRLGVGEFVLVDPERAELSNLPRLTAASRFDAMTWLVDETNPKWLRRFAMRLARPKVLLARRNILRANRHARVDAVFGNFLEEDIAAKFIDCDYLFLAADTMRARLLFNAIVHQYLIPGVQVGAKVRVDPANGEVLDAYSVVRPVTSETGCLLCNNLINSAKLQEESISNRERKRQRYVDEPEIVAPSVITLNAVAVSHAANDFLFYMTGLRDPLTPSAYLRVQPQSRRTWLDEPRRSAACPECGSNPNSRLARGDGRRLPTIVRGGLRDSEESRVQGDVVRTDYI